MKRRPEDLIRLALVVCLACLVSPTSAQEMWKYTDKDGKVTYSDKAPKQGEKAERVNADTTGTVIPASKNTLGGKTQSSATVSARAAEREALREIYRKAIDAAREELEQARKALEAGQEPTDQERQIVVGRGKEGRATGNNALIRKPEYYERIASLETAVKQAEDKVANAEKSFRDNAPK